jgi:hypothetical protein
MLHDIFQDLHFVYMRFHTPRYTNHELKINLVTTVGFIRSVLIKPRKVLKLSLADEISGSHGEYEDCHLRCCAV